MLTNQQEFRNANSASVIYRGRRCSSTRRVDVEYGACRSVQIFSGDLLTLINTDGGGAAWLVVLDSGSNSTDPGLLGLNANPETPLNYLGFDDRELSAKLSARGLNLSDCNVCLIFDENTLPQERFVFQAKSACEVFVIIPVKHDGLETGAGGHMALEVQSQ